MQRLLHLEVFFESCFAVALAEKRVSKCAEDPVEAIKTCSSPPPAVDVRTLLLDRTTRLRHFFILQSKEAPCVVATHVPLFNQNLEIDWQQQSGY